MYTVDIHKHNETVKDAIKELEVAITFGRKEKDRILCVVVGYGSTSGHQRIKTSVIEYLDEKIGKGIKDYLIGSEVDIFNPRYQKCKFGSKLPKEAFWDKNPGIIYIFL